MVWHVLLIFVPTKRCPRNVSCNYGGLFMSGNNSALVCPGLSFDPFCPEFFVVPTESSIRVLVKLAVDL